MGSEDVIDYFQRWNRQVCRNHNGCQEVQVQEHGAPLGIIMNALDKLGNAVGNFFLSALGFAS